MTTHRLYGIFYADPVTGRPVWGMHRNGRTARKIGRERNALVVSMPLPATRLWDAPTFRVCADRVEYAPQ